MEREDALMTENEIKGLGARKLTWLTVFHSFVCAAKPEMDPNNQRACGVTKRFIR
jgi:hypothetical protein